MPGYRKLGFASKERKAAFRKLTTDLLYYGRITTTLTRARELRKFVEPLITLAIREHENYSQVTIKVKVPKKDGNGKRIRQEVDGKRVEVFEEVEKTIKKDNPSRLNARRKMLSWFYPITELPQNAKKKKVVNFDLVRKVFDEIAPKYAQRQGGYTRIIKLGPRKGDAAQMVIIELV